MAGGTRLSRHARTSRALNNRLRIIGGRWRGRKLAFPDGEGLRPTSDRIRETLFNWLQDDIADARCLDLFAGSGALGLEALSRGAANVLMCDSNPQVIRQLQANLDTLQAEGAELLQAPALDMLQAGPTGQPFDVVFLDPPFAQQLLGRCIHMLEAHGWLAPMAKIYLESASEQEFPELPENWQLLREKTAGQVSYRLALRKPPADPATGNCS